MKRSSWWTLRAALLTAVTAELACGRAPVAGDETGESLGTEEGSGTAADSSASGGVTSAASEAGEVDTGEAEATDTGEAEVTTTEGEADVSTDDGGDGDVSTDDGSTDATSTDDGSTDTTATDTTSTDASSTDTGGDGDGDTSTTTSSTGGDGDDTTTTGGDGDGDGDMEPIFEDEPCPFEGATRCYGDVLRECSSPESGSMWSYVETCDWCLDVCEQGFARCHDWSYDTCGGQCFDPSAGAMGCSYPLGNSFSPLTGTIVFDGDGVFKYVDPVTCDSADGFWVEEVMVGEWVLHTCGQACVELNEAVSMEVFEECLVPGRPLFVDGELRAASVETVAGWSAEMPAAPAPDLERAARYAEVGRIEHASIASFARFVAQLMAVGAPARFVTDAQQAMADEIEHAKLAFALASAYAQQPLGPGPLPEACAPIETELDAIVWATFEEGCINETLAAAEAGQMAAALDSGPERDFWNRVAADETRHAALAWAFVTWAWSRVSEETRSRILARGRQAASLHRCQAEAPRLRGDDLWNRPRRAEVAMAAMADLVAPALERLAA